MTILAWPKKKITKELWILSIDDLQVFLQHAKIVHSMKPSSLQFWLFLCWFKSGWFGTCIYFLLQEQSCILLLSLQSAALAVQWCRKVAPSRCNSALNLVSGAPKESFFPLVCGFCNTPIETESYLCASLAPPAQSGSADSSGLLWTWGLHSKSVWISGIEHKKSVCARGRQENDSVHWGKSYSTACEKN